MLATATLWVRIQASLKNTIWATLAKEWPTHSSPPKKKYKKNFVPVRAKECEIPRSVRRKRWRRMKEKKVHGSR
jgi:hypothetical protein